ncbi:hypothetical protein [Actinoplanes regularis]|uniref:hypothetical protein n=1 Tax=Actinoplanes regularis TaxID=52697 RepID=UPI0024A14BB0|nr:hypothetical protein [Actinoplanes regularis]GLW32288.1 hypothetical protein Areg01_52270 [Actinoplanes regularis]
MAKYRVDTEIEHGDRKVTDRITVNSSRGVDRIRRETRERAPLGSTVSVKATRKG